MSGILERIVRRRRATASSRLGPPPESEVPPAPASSLGNGTTPVNGGPPVHVEAQANGSVPADPEVAEDESAPVEAQPAQVVEAQPAQVAEAQPAQAEAQPASVEAQPVPLDPEPVDPEPDDPLDVDPGPAPEPQPAEPPTILERGRIRRRARYLQRLREVQLRDLGGFIVELRRFERERPDLVEGKVRNALQTDAELRMLERALGSDQPLRELREAGIGGVCTHCGAVHGSVDRFCASCGEPLQGAVDDEHGK